GRSPSSLRGSGFARATRAWTRLFTKTMVGIMDFRQGFRQAVVSASTAKYALICRRSDSTNEQNFDRLIAADAANPITDDAALPVTDAAALQHHDRLAGLAIHESGFRGLAADASSTARSLLVYRRAAMTERPHETRRGIKTARASTASGK